MPVRKVWDHAIDLKENFKASKAKVYPFVMNQLDPIEKLYNIYSGEEDPPKIVEVEDDGLDFDSDVEGPVDPYMDL